MIRLIEFRELAKAEKDAAMRSFVRDTRLDLTAFERVSASIRLWDAETGEPSLDSGNFPQKG